MRLFWHRSDLRATDNLGLASAARDGEVLPVFVFDDAVLKHGSAPRVAHLLDALSELRTRYRALGGNLHVARGDPARVLVDLAEAYDADAVEWNRDYSGLAQRRDEAVAAALEDAGNDVASHHDAVHHEPGSITTNAGDPYAVYSYYWKKWRGREKRDPLAAPDSGIVDAPNRELPTLDALGFDDPEADVEPGGREAATQRLDAFCDGPIYRYEEQRDDPAADATSHLSAHLRWGTVGVREVYAATEQAMAEAPDDAARESVETFRGELAWREFYTQVLYYNPEVVTQNYNEYEAGIDWRDDPDEIEAWKRGETGYPIVDAGMRQLREEAWMHNRVRMIVASFLTKDLLADWRHGYAHFRERLVDHNTANDNGGWQWAASTGTDAQPYFRIFNPTSQGERYDPNAAYIHEYVPELRGVEAADIHAWPDLDPERRADLAPTYPEPIVDHGERRQEALAMFKRARGEDPDE